MKLAKLNWQEGKTQKRSTNAEAEIRLDWSLRGQGLDQ